MALTEITSLSIKDAEVKTADIAADAVTAAKIADDVINSEHIAAGAIDLEHMSSESVDEDNLHISNAGSNGQFLSKQSGNSGGLTWADASVGGATGTDYNDNVKVRFGTGNDLEIYHDASHSIITNSTGDLSLISTGDDVFIKAADDVFIRTQGDESAITCTGDAGVELYNDNVKTLATVSNGAAIYGSEGNAANFFLYADEGDDHADCWRLEAEAAGDFTIKNYAASSWENCIRASGNGDVELYYDNVKTFYTTSGGIVAQGPEGGDGMVYIYADEGDDDADKWRNIAVNDGTFHIQNLASGSWETNIECNGNGNVELYYDASKKLETTSNGVTVTGLLSTTANVGVQDTGRFYFGNSDVASIDGSHGGSGYLKFLTNGNERMKIDASGHLLPNANNTYDLGSSSLGWRNIHKNDLHLSNEGSVNDVDGTWGKYTIQEGEDDLFLINRRNGKKYKFNLTEVS